MQGHHHQQWQTNQKIDTTTVCSLEAASACGDCSRMSSDVGGVSKTTTQRSNPDGDGSPFREPPEKTVVEALNLTAESCLQTVRFDVTAHADEQ